MDSTRISSARDRTKISLGKVWAFGVEFIWFSVLQSQQIDLGVWFSQDCIRLSQYVFKNFCYSRSAMHICKHRLYKNSWILSVPIMTQPINSFFFFITYKLFHHEKEILKSENRPGKFETTHLCNNRTTNSWWTYCWNCRVLSIEWNSRVSKTWLQLWFTFQVQRFPPCWGSILRANSTLSRMQWWLVSPSLHLTLLRESCVVLKL